MRRLPNPWIAIPSLGLGVLAAALAWVVASVSCDLSDPLTGCVGWSAAAALGAFGLVAIGTALVLVLVFRSIGEWQERREDSSR